MTVQEIIVKMHNGTVTEDEMAEMLTMLIDQPLMVVMQCDKGSIIKIRSMEDDTETTVDNLQNVKLMTVINQETKQLVLPLFTDHDEFKKFTEKMNFTDEQLQSKMPAFIQLLDCHHLLNEQPSLAGIVINSATTPVELSADDVHYFISLMYKDREVPFVPEGVIS